MDPHVLDPAAVPPASTDPAVPCFWVCAEVRSGRVSVAGELDREHAHHVLDALAALSGADCARWTLEARRVTFCDAEGLRLLLAADRLACHHGRQLSVLASPWVRRLVVLVGLERLVDGAPAQAGPGAA